MTATVRLHYNMVGTFQATATFQDSDIFQKAMKMGAEIHFECEFSLFRIQTKAGLTHATASKLLLRDTVQWYYASTVPQLSHAADRPCHCCT